jgi:2-phospho-L-lactate/phosphoenolpyruvate guanylyltransferase
MTVLILIPCKNFDQGKSRLTPELAPASRRALCEQFLCQTVALATSMISPNQVKIVTDDPRAVRIGGDYGASIMPDLGTDLNSTLTEARRLLLSDRSCEPSVLILPTDLPYANSAAISIVLGSPADIVIVPDQERQGTNLLFLRFRAFQNFSFSFGPNSFARHCAAAKSAGHAMQIVCDDRLAFDVDQPRHYVQWQSGTGYSEV